VAAGPDGLYIKLVKGADKAIAVNVAKMRPLRRAMFSVADLLVVLLTAEA
jgi:hypothetical protein